ncbi:uncharacterized protein BDZ99DRAFT_567819 [Mytilinidion resinicola]|uniref:Uncharacterized protein n=1 Tax=Mytilinidion resinicola TaxID=574789 RepID=A0A6A6Z1N5_9PEZI|nr:uncharacterized protein BDZ99DRAFT_567819 [Mytilinidion resinicola]KAF2814147.1 hypothetical protein BDZ99DRAFT_567819 [Mytilinidion resinicola]
MPSLPSLTTLTTRTTRTLLLAARAATKTPKPAKIRPKKHGISGWAVFLIVLLILLILAAVAWVAYSRLRARRLGLPPPPLNPFAASRSGPSSNYPAPAPGGLKGWLDTQVRKFKNRRYASGAYEEPTGYGGAGGGAPRGRAGHGPLDPDEAWDARVGNEAYYEEQELGLHAPAPAPGGAAAYGGPTGYTGAYGGEGFSGGERGRSRTRELDERYEEEVHGGAKHATNPFGDDNAVSSLRGVSPRPLETERTGGAYGAPAGHKKTESAESSPTERRSMFRENM